MKTEKLSREEFGRALRLGLGRVMLHVRVYGDEGMEDLIEDALVSSYAYDTQLEGTRTDWMLDILRHAGGLGKYATRLIERFNTCESNNRDLVQQIELSANLFDCGHEEFRQIAISKYKLLKSMDESSVSSAQCLIYCCGIPGLALAASMEISTKKNENIDRNWEYSQILECAENFLPDEPTRLLNEWSNKNSDIRLFKEAVERNDESESVRGDGLEKQSNNCSLEDINSIGAAHRFAKSASDSDLMQILEKLKTSEDPREQLFLLSSFAAKDLPQIDQRVLDLLRSPEKKVRRAAVKALSRLTSPTVRQLALRNFNSDEDEWIEHAFSLLVNNFAADDVQMMEHNLKRVVDRDHLHWAGMSLKELAGKEKNIALIPILLWLHNYGPDGFCRKDILKVLLEWQECPMDILYEGQWDSYSENQAICRSILSKNVAGVHVEGIEF